jgi:hypothetical protein
VAEPPSVGLGWLLFVGSSVHVVSTGWLFTAREVRAQVVRHRVRYLWAPLGLICSAALLAVVIPPQALNGLLLPYFGWQFWHYQRQNYGLAALAAAFQAVPSMRARERQALLITGCAGGAGLLVHPALLQLQLQLAPGLTSVLQVAFALAGVALVLGIVHGLVALWLRPADQRPAEYCAGFLMALLFFAPVFIFTSPYTAVGGLVVAHGLQYLVLVGLVATGDRRGADRLRFLMVLACLALVAGAVLNASSHLHASGPLGRLCYGAYLGVVMTHFVVDAGIWRLRDPSSRQFISSRVPFLVPPRPSSVADRPGPDICSRV